MTEPKGLASALAQLQTQLPKIPKTKKADAGTYRYAYADLDDISEQLLPILGKLGLSFSSFPTITADGRFVLRYTLRHTSGESDGGEYPLPNGTPQQVGSAITYGRRYCLCAATGVSPGGDDDGAAAGRITQPPRQPKPPADTSWVQTTEKPAKPKASAHSTAGDRPAGDDLPITPKQLTKLQICLKDYGITDRDAGLAYYADVIGHEVASSKDLTVAEASKVIDQLTRELGQGQDVTPPDPTLDDDWQAES